MPEIFDENSKLKIIEYGHNESMADIVRDVKESLMKLLKS